MEPINEIDSGMMPPPSTLPLSVRRPSSAGNLLVEQISPPLMKTELNDDSSQSSLPDTMNHDALDRMTINENSMDGSGGYVPHRIRKRSIDMMDSNSMMSTPVLMHDSSSMSGFAARDAQINLMQSPEIVDLRIKQEQIAAQLQFQLAASKAESDLNQSVNKFLSNLESNSLSPRVDSVAVALYANNTASNEALMQEINNINQLATTSAVMNQSAFGHALPLMTEAETSSSLNQMLSYPTPQNTETLMDTSSSNHSHDVILNSQPAVSINSPNHQITMLASPNVNNAEHNMSTDVILNPAVSPSMMCQSNDAIPPQVTSVLACHPMQPSSQDTLLNNLLQPDALHIPRTSPVAVKNMILNAAADILSSQPSQISAENTINALMSLNSSPMMTQAGTANNMMEMHPNNQSALNDAICTQTTLEQHLPIFTNEPSIMANQMLTNPTMNSDAGNMMNISISNMVTTTQALIDREIRNDQIVRAQQEYLNDLQKNMT